MTLSPGSCSRVGAFHLAAAVILGCTVDAQAATSPPVKDTYITLSLPGIVGDFTLVPNAPTNSIQVLSVSVGAVCVPAAVGTACTGVPNVSALNVIKSADGASPKLFMTLVGRGLFATATFQFWELPTTGTNFTKTYTIVLTDAVLETFQDSAAEGGSPIESLSFTFKTITFEDNVLNVASCYNVATNTTTATATC